MYSDLVHKALLQPQTYPEAPARVEFRETHVSRLYFTPDFVYKVKKAVDFGFLNFTSLDRRRFYCEEEVRLNRRFAPDTYLGVREIRRGPQGVKLDGEGDVLDYVVWMKRLPAERMLDVMIDADAAELPQAMGQLAQVLARMEHEAEVHRDNGGTSHLEAVRRNWRENFEQTAPFAGQTLSPCTLETCRRYVDLFMERHAALMLRREEQGYIRDGHGDLHAEHICLTDPIRIYDCIEFNRRFRVADVVADMAFVLMDLDMRGRRDLTELLQTGYMTAADPDPDFLTLLPFYKVYRAFVRGKVHSFLWADTEAQQATREHGRELAHAYFNLALGYLVPPCLVVTCGLMGVGKTTLARQLARATGAQVLRSDVIRKELAGLDPEQSLQEDFDGGLYSGPWTKRTYEALAERAAQGLKQGNVVIVDASFSQENWRRHFLDLAENAGKAALIVYLHAEDGILYERLQQRMTSARDASDGRPALLESQKQQFDVPEPGPQLLRLDSGSAVQNPVEQVLCAILEQTGFRHE